LGREDYLNWANETFDITKIFEKPEVLKGLRVVELCTLILGPADAVFLAEMGAEVIKIELPGTGDTMRYVTPRGMFWKNAGLGFFSENRNKYHVTIDVRRPEGKDLFRKLIAKSDVFMENLTGKQGGSKGTVLLLPCSATGCDKERFPCHIQLSFAI